MCCLGILCEMPFFVFLLLAMDLLTMKVFNKQEQGTDDLCHCRPKGGRRWAAATCQWEHCILLVPWKDRGGSPQANQTIPTAGWLPSKALLSLCLPLCVPPSQSVLLSVHLSLKHTVDPFTSSGGTMALQRASPSPCSLPGCEYLLCSPDLFWVN